MSSSDRQFQYIPRYKHFAKAQFYQAPSDLERHSLLCFIILQVRHILTVSPGVMVQWVLDAITSRLCIVLMAMRFSLLSYLATVYDALVLGSVELQIHGEDIQLC